MDVSAGFSSDIVSDREELKKRLRERLSELKRKRHATDDEDGDRALSTSSPRGTCP